VTEEQARRQAIEHWMRRTAEALDAAKSEASAERYEFALNRSYYACFYAASAVLLNMGREFVKHSGLRAAVHQHLVKPGLVDKRFGKIFDSLFESRQSADYIATASFEMSEATAAIREAEEFVHEMQQLLERTP
jgi:uncharacterized protein